MRDSLDAAVVILAYVGATVASIGIMVLFGLGVWHFAEWSFK